MTTLGISAQYWITLRVEQPTATVLSHTLLLPDAELWIIGDVLLSFEPGAKWMRGVSLALSCFGVLPKFHLEEVFGSLITNQVLLNTLTTRNKAEGRPPLLPFTNTPHVAHLWLFF